MRLTQVRLLVNDFHAMLSFYRDTLGLRVGFDDGENFAEGKAGEGDRAALIAPPKDMAPWGIRIALFRDPEGNLVEINQRLARG